VVQAEAMKYFIEFWRMAKFDRTGILWWNLRDGWPVISDAIVDYYNSRKLAYDYIRKVQTDVCVMIGDAAEGQHPVVAVNDTRGEVSGTMTITDADTKKVLLSKTFTVAENGKSTLAYLPETGETKLWLIEWVVDEKKYNNHYLAYQPPVMLDQYLAWLPLINK
jgi:beta-mannosidase